jgi:hypothetical protein
MPWGPAVGRTAAGVGTPDGPTGSDGPSWFGRRGAGVQHWWSPRRTTMVWLLVLFLILALVFGIGGAIEVSLWFLLLLVLAVAIAALLARTLMGGRR